METNSEVICLLELANLSVKTIITIIFRMFKKLGELLNMEDVKKAQILLSEMRNTMVEMKNILLDGINNWLDIAEDKINELEHSNINYTSWNTERKMTLNKWTDRSSVSCGKTSNKLT